VTIKTAPSQIATHKYHMAYLRVFPKIAFKLLLWLSDGPGVRTFTVLSGFARCRLRFNPESRSGMSVSSPSLTQKARHPAGNKSAAGQKEGSHRFVTDTALGRPWLISHSLSNRNRCPRRTGWKTGPFQAYPGLRR